MALFCGNKIFLLLCTVKRCSHIRLFDMNAMTVVINNMHGLDLQKPKILGIRKDCKPFFQFSVTQVFVCKGYLLLL